MGMLTLTFRLSDASPKRSSIESIMPWPWMSGSVASFMAVSTSEPSMMSEEAQAELSAGRPGWCHGIGEVFAAGEGYLMKLWTYYH